MKLRTTSYTSLSGVFIVCALLFTMTPVSTTAFAAPTTAEINAVRQEATNAREKIDAMSVQLEMASEDYAQAQANVRKTQTEIQTLSQKLVIEQSKLNELQKRLNQRASSIYKEGYSTYLDIFFGSQSFSDLVSRLSFMQKISQQDTDLLVSVRSVKAQIELARHNLEAKKAIQEIEKKKAEQKKQEAERVYADQQQYIRSLDAKITDMVAQQQAEIEAQQAARARAEAARQEAERRAAAQRATQEAMGNPSSGSVSTEPKSTSSYSSGIRGERTFNPDTLGASHPQAVDVALRYVGVTWYEWGGTTPSGFDCSGLTMYSYNKIGISIPRTSREQYRCGSYIPPTRKDLLKPGDLVFFATTSDVSTIHHVGMYIGNGQFVHAPQTGRKVSIAYLSSRSDFIGAVRP